MLRRRFASVALATVALGSVTLARPAAAQWGPPQPQQPYPQQPQQPYPQQQQPYPQQYPPQQYPPQQYPPQPAQPAAPPRTDDRRSRGEMTFLYLTSGAYGVGSGIWLDSLFKITDPGVAAILPITLGAAAPVGMFLWDEFGGPFHRGVPASMATGLALGAVEGMAIAGTQWQYARDDGKDWPFATQTTITFLAATGGGLGGWAFGEWLRPDPRSMGFIAGASSWGAISGTLLGAGVSGRDWKDGASVAGLVGYNVGIAGGGALSIVHTPSWESQKYMWLGYGLGTLAGFVVYPFYLFVKDPQVKRGMIANALGGVAGAAIAGAVTWDMRDAEDGPARAANAPKTWKPPFDVSVLPAPRLTTSALGGSLGARGELDGRGGNEAPIGPSADGAMLNALGTF